MPSDAASYPLKSRTPRRWVDQVLAQPLALLNDHAHLEKKAAGNALDLINRRPENATALAQTWVTTMTGVARDEIEHLATVVRLLNRRGGRMTRHHRNGYAAALRQNVRTGRGPEELIDRLMVCALIEVRSCERFELLSQHCPDQALAKLYRGLTASERGHYQVFINLARELEPSDTVESRWRWWLQTESDILAAQPPGCGMHSGVAQAESEPS